MKIFSLCLATALSLMLVSKHAVSQVSAPMDTLVSIDALVKAAKLSLHYKGKSICAKDAIARDLAQAIANYSITRPDKGGELSNEEIYLALISHFPCPFNPKKAPVRHAVTTDLIGHWELVPASFKLNPQIFQNEIFPSNCQYFAYAEDGKRLSIDMITKGTCPTVTISDLQKLKAFPKTGTIDWKLEPKGMLKITSTVIPTYIESWETFIVDSPFSRDGVMFEPGNLLMFLNQYNQAKGEEVGTLYFRQLRKMAGS